MGYEKNLFLKVKNAHHFFNCLYPSTCFLFFCTGSSIPSFFFPFSLILIGLFFFLFLPELSIHFFFWFFSFAFFSLFGGIKVAHKKMKRKRGEKEFKDDLVIVEIESLRGVRAGNYFEKYQVMVKKRGFCTFETFSLIKFL